MKVYREYYTKPAGIGYRIAIHFSKLTFGVGWKIKTYHPQKFFYFQKQSWCDETKIDTQIGRLMFGIKWNRRLKGDVE